MRDQPIILIGAGGHAKGIVEIIENGPYSLAGYTGPAESDWLQSPYLGEDGTIKSEMGAIALGFGAVKPKGLKRRLNLLENFCAAGFATPPIISNKAIVSPSAEIGNGCHILPGALINAAGRIGTGCIVNSGAIIEHDAEIGDGSHIAPGAIVLGNAAIGGCCMIGAGAVILPGTRVPDETLIAANTRYGA